MILENLFQKSQKCIVSSKHTSKTPISHSREFTKTRISHSHVLRTLIWHFDYFHDFEKPLSENSKIHCVIKTYIENTNLAFSRFREFTNLAFSCFKNSCRALWLFSWFWKTSCRKTKKILCHQNIHQKHESRILANSRKHESRILMFFKTLVGHFDYFHDFGKPYVEKEKIHYVVESYIKNMNLAFSRFREFTNIACSCFKNSYMALWLFSWFWKTSNRKTKNTLCRRNIHQKHESRILANSRKHESRILMF